MKNNAEKIIVTTIVNEEEVMAGTIFNHGDSISFSYDKEFIALPSSYDLFPCLPRTSFVPFHFNGIGPFSDCAPDRWGRTLINRAKKRNKLSEMEYLLNVDDTARQGALRFYINDIAQADRSSIPFIVELPELLNIADDVMLNNEITDENADKLFHATGSLGGARPKACVYQNKELFIAKFPKPAGDAWDIIGWEYVTNKLAKQFGISTCEAQIISITDNTGRPRNTMLAKRFDRKGKDRLHYMSALTTLELIDGESADWQDLAEFVQEIDADLEQLWKRAIFGCAIGNLDNHLRNHAFLMQEHSWELSPAFDMNPEPLNKKGSTNDIFQLSLFGEQELNINAFTTKECLELFNISNEQCKNTLEQLTNVLRNAIKLACKSNLDAKSIEMLAPRFEHAVQELSQC